MKMYETYEMYEIYESQFGASVKDPEQGDKVFAKVSPVRQELPLAQKLKLTPSY